MTHAERMARFSDPGLYVVITEAHCGGRRSLDVLEAVLEAGVRLVQFREKGLESGVLYEKARTFRQRTHEAGALLIVDDRVDVALAVNADGVHLGLSDLPIEAARRIAPHLIIGGSSHNLKEAMAAQSAGASYVNIGPIFPTQTKDVPTGAVGPEMIEAIVPHLHIPWTTMGGLKPHNIGHVIERGARHPAVVTAVTAAPNPHAAAAELHEMVVAAGETRHG